MFDGLMTPTPSLAMANKLGLVTCVVCGARVRNRNPKTVTCDSICTAARKAHRTRGAQIAQEMKQADTDYLGVFFFYGN